LGVNLLETVGASLHELPWFLAYMATAVALTLFYVVVYMWATPHDEIALIRENNAAASTAFAGSLLGFCLPLASAITHSASLVDCAVWGGVALIIQIAIFFLVRIPVPKISERIEKNEIASGVWLGATSLAGGLLNAASMTN
jgi:putative membrane protein